MIQEFIDRFMERKADLRKVFENRHVESYKELVTETIKIISDPNDYFSIDPNRIHEIDDGEYQGTLLYIIADKSYQPDDYWYVRVWYGSCSGCDTLLEINSYSSGDRPTQKQVDQYMTLALHIVERIKKME